MMIPESLTVINTPEIIEIVINNIAAVVIGLFIFLTYKLTYTGTAYSKRFNVSLSMMVIITTLIMNVISSNIALSLGLTGALSIIRFRAAIKDVRDATFIFWAIGIGICCGVSQYIPAIIGSITLMLFLLMLGQVKTEGVYLIIVKSSLEAQTQVETMMQKYLQGKQHLRAKNSSLSTVDIIYEINMKTLNKLEKSLKCSLTEKILKLEGVESVNQIEQSEDISR